MAHGLLNGFPAYVMPYTLLVLRWSNSFLKKHEEEYPVHQTLPQHDVGTQIYRVYEYSHTFLSLTRPS